ncbi:16376_t:CDS:2, partial [Funneliformis geosporum]
SLESYEIPREQEQVEMINNLVNNLQNTKRKREIEDINSLDIDINDDNNAKKNKGF